MHFGLDEDQLALQEAVRGYLSELDGPRSTEDLWPRIVEEQGWQAILVPEEQGGWGYGLVELAVVFEELGRSLTPCPLLSVALATLASDDADVLEAIAGGTRVALATGEFRVAGNQLSGTARKVIDGPDAELFLVATTEGLFAVPASAVEVRRLEGLDPTRPLADVVLENVTVGAPSPIDLEAVLRVGAVLQAAEQVGIAEACMDLAVDYAKVRKQFGVAIGTFQAIQHKCADMLLLVESARSAALYASWALQTDAPDAIEAAHTAAATAKEAAFTVAAESIQVHGGIGFTWEHDAHFYFKRARAGVTLLGSPRHHREAVAKRILD